MQCGLCDGVRDPCRDGLDKCLIYFFESAVADSLQGYFHSILEHFCCRSVFHLFDELVDLRGLDAFEVISYGHVEYESVRIAESKLF